jgi:ferrous iron transport protein A
MPSNNTSVRLSDLALGQGAQVVAIHCADSLAQRLSALGFRAGKPLQLMRAGKLAGPLHVRLGTTDVILRRSEAAQIEVLPVASSEATAASPAPGEGAQA